MRTGALRNVVDIQQVTETRDNHGETVKTWALFKRVHAAIYLVESANIKDEQFLLHGEHNMITHKIVIRYLNGVTPQMRVLFRSKIYQIRKVPDINGYQKILNLACEERPNDQY